MQPVAGGGYGGGIARVQSVPASWLEALLLSDDQDNIITDPPKTSFDQHPSVTTTTFVDSSMILRGHDSAFLRQKSSPVELLTHVNNSGINPVKVCCDDQLSSSLDVKRFGDVSLEDSRLKFATQMDVAPIRARAKRGFATHPRSIAERVRRTRISDRIRKLQELVPNTIKQTNTADMLEDVVEYVKFLQNQIQDLTEHQINARVLCKD